MHACLFFSASSLRRVYTTNGGSLEITSQIINNSGWQNNYISNSTFLSIAGNILNFYISFHICFKMTHDTGKSICFVLKLK